jgi:phosphatidate cytidylyltransferase
MLKYRLIFGTLMTVVFTALVILDGWLDGSLTAAAADDAPVKSTVLFLLIALLIVPATLELSALAAAKNMKIFTPVSITSSILFAGCWYWPQILELSPQIYLVLLSAFSLFTLLLYQNLRYGMDGTLANCGVNCFSILYLGLLSTFVMAIRIEFGVWPLLMFVFVVKCADIGAYTTGSLFGKHRFSPKISPGKTWEGIAGAVLFAMIIAVLFAVIFGIMVWPLALLFGFSFAFIGQLGDLAESMLKRDARQKDASDNVPGFGGILDVIDSPLAAAPFAYLFFVLVLR